MELDILRAPNFRAVASVGSESSRAFRCCIGGSARGSGKGPGSQAEWNADKQRLLLLIFLVEVGPEGGCLRGRFAFGPGKDLVWKGHKNSKSETKFASLKERPVREETGPDRLLRKDSGVPAVLRGCLVCRAVDYAIESLAGDNRLWLFAVRFWRVRCLGLRAVGLKMELK